MGNISPKGPVSIVRTWAKTPYDRGVHVQHAVYLFEKVSKDDVVYAEYEISTWQHDSVTTVSARRQYIVYPLGDIGSPDVHVVGVTDLPPAWRKAMDLARRRWRATAWTLGIGASFLAWISFVALCRFTNCVSLFAPSVQPSSEVVLAFALLHVFAFVALLCYAACPALVGERTLIRSLRRTSPVFPPAPTNA